MRFTKFIAATLAVTLTLGFGLADPASKKGKTMPKYSIKTTSGKTFTNATTKGKVVIFDFWATWCGPCVAASPTMQKLHEKYAKKGLVVIGMNTESGSKIPTDYAKKHKYTYLQGYDITDVAKSLEIEPIPVFVFVDKKGVIQRVDTGYNPTKSPASFEKTVKDLLAKK